MGLRVIGSGLGRTGTMSLKLALEQLGFGPCHHMKEVLDHPESVPLWIDAFENRPDWDAIFESYNSVIDAPGCRFWRELSEYYPKPRYYTRCAIPMPGSTPPNRASSPPTSIALIPFRHLTDSSSTTCAPSGTGSTTAPS